MMEHGEALAVMDPAFVQPVSGIVHAGEMRRGKLEGARPAVAATVGTRLLVWAAAMATIAIFGENTVAWHVLDPAGVTPAMHSGVLNAFLAPAARWDSVWYLLIATHGYFNPASTNFFPLYPLLVGLGDRVFDNPILVGIAISFGCTVAALTLLYRLALLDLDAPAARMTVLLVSVFPASLFLSAVYPTSLFLLLTVAAIYAARREQWALAGLCGGLASATRSNGILLIGALALLYLYGPRGRAPHHQRVGAWWRPRFPIERDIAWLALVPAGLAVYLGYLLAAHGAPLAPFRAAGTDWGHSFGPPFASVVKALGEVPSDLWALLDRTATPIGPGDPISWQSRDLIDVVFAGVGVAAVALAWRRVPRVYSIFAIVQLAQITSFPTKTEPLIGLPRYLLPIFPLFMGGGAYLAERRTAARITLVASTGLLVLFSALWGYWALVP
jgi:Mannosyltransferase (PIG-V)